ncbi:MAG: hypothetical protein LBL66_07170 [Clostridiales bacterium]|jgi:hypothetical protein|nr:hypothetical protein [Clostridiales bacterium]
MKKRVFVIAFATFAVVAAVCAVLSLGQGRVRAEKFYTSDFFEYTNASVQEAAAGADGRRGLLITGSTVGARAKTVDTLSGAFDAEFSFAGDGLTRLSVLVEDQNNPSNGFGIHIGRGDGALNASVSAFGREAGIFYSGGAPVGGTAAKNAAGKYTSVPENTRANRLIFNPDDMTVCIADGDNEFLVWDFFFSRNDRAEIGGTLDAMPEYEIAFVFEKTDGKSGLILYRLNGQRFDTPLLSGAGVNSAGPRIFADVAVNGAAGKPYKIPAPYAYDVADGAVTGAECEALKDGETVMSRRPYAEGLAFTPPAAGKYTIRYSARDGRGVKTTKDYPLAVSEALDPGVAAVSLSQAETEGALGAGSKTVLAAGTVSTPVAVAPERAFATRLTVKRDGAVLDGYDGIFVAPGMEFTFAETGAYEFIYVSANAQIDCAAKREITVSAGLPAIGAANTPSWRPLGDTVAFDIPEISFGTETKPAVPVLQFPSGAAYTGKTHILNETGQYTLQYGAQFGGRPYCFSRAFLVGERAYSVREGDFAGYGRTDYLQGRGGINISLARGNEFTCNKVIDISGNTSSDRLLELYFTPETPGVRESNGVEIRIIDARDPDNFVTVQSNRNSGDPLLSYIRTGAAGQALSGYEGGSPASPYSNFHVGNSYGRVCTLSPSGAVRPGNAEIAPMEIYFDYAEKSLHIGNTGFAGQENRLICDLDDPTQFPDPWKGFATGEVVVSIRAYIPVAARCNYFLADLNGLPLEKAYIEGDAPVIQIDTQGLDENALPDAAAGRNYPVFAARAKDADGELAVSVSVSAVFAYQTPHEICFDVAGGVFTPPIPGEYALVYTAKNRFGKTAVKVLYITAVQTPVGVSAAVSPEALSGYAGIPATLPEPDVTGGSGPYLVEISYLSPSGKAGTVYGGVFTPVENGEYILTYRATDYLGARGEAGLSFTAWANPVPVFEGEPDFPAAFIQGTAYALPTVYATDYSGASPVRAPAAVSVEYGGGEKPVPDGVYSPAVGASGDIVTVVYRAGTSEMRVLVPVKILKSGQGYDMTQYFAESGMTVSSDADGVYLEAAAPGAYAEYLIPLSAGTFNLNFNISPTPAANRVDFHLRDSQNPGIALKLSLLRGAANGATSFFSVNDGQPYRIKGSFYNVAGTTFVLYYDAVQNRFRDGVSMSAAVGTTLSGAAFGGFPSGLVRMAVSVPDGAGKVAFRTVNEQKMSSSGTDGKEPDIYIEERAAKTFALGAEYAIPAAVAADVLDTEVAFTVTVKGPDGAVMRDKDGVPLENVPAAPYVIALSRVGAYTVTYRAVDSSGNGAQAIYRVYAADTEPPVITLFAESIADVKVGGAAAIPSATAEDTVSGASTVFVTVVRPDGLSTVPNGATAVAEIAGKYTVRYTAFDTYGNMATRVLTFNAA